MIYILPINHEFQGTNPNTNIKTKNFIAFVKQIISQYNIFLVAEEWTDKVTTFNFDNTSNIERVVGVLIESGRVVQYKRIEMNTKERTERNIPWPREIEKNSKVHLDLLLSSEEKKHFLDIETAKYFPERENYWLEKMKNDFDKNILLVIGASHTSIGNSHLGNIKGFDTKLKEKGWKVIIVSEEYF